MFQHLRQYLARVALACRAFVWLVAVADASEIESFDVIRMNTGPAAAGGEALHEPFFGASKVAARAGDRLFFSTVDGRQFDVVLRRTELSRLGNTIFHGEMSGGGPFLLVIDPKGAAVGSFTIEDLRYNLFTHTDGSIRLFDQSISIERPIDTAARRGKPLPRHELADELDLERRVIKWDSPSSSAAEPASDVNYPVFQSGESVATVLVYYDESMANASSIIDLMVTVANNAFEASNARFRLVVAHTKAVPIDDEATIDAVLTLMLDRSAPFADLEADRGEHEADLVYALKDTWGVDEENCGLAIRGLPDGVGPYRSWFEGIVLWDLGDNPDFACSDLTFAHEIGHSLGANHDRTTETDDEGNVERAYYSYGYGYVKSGLWKTVMAYGDEKRLSKFSSPVLDCEGSPCGVAASEPDSADVAQLLRHSGPLIASYEGDFQYEAVRSVAYRGEDFDCTTSDDESGFFRGVGIRNQSSVPVDMISVHYERPDGTYQVYEYEAGERVAESGGSATSGFCRASDDDPVVGTDYVAAFIRYRHPDTGAVIETAKREFDEDYKGKYWLLRAAAGPGGKVVGNPSQFVREGSSSSFTFEPDDGYKLDSVESTCNGKQNGNTFAIDVGADECFSVAKFAADTPSDATFRLKLEEPINGEIHMGIGNLRGWSVASSGIEKVEIFIDGAYLDDAPYGGARDDIAGVFPDVESSGKSGFSQSFNYGILSAGEHTIKLVAHSELGNTVERNATFSVVKFASDYISDPDAVDFDQASCSLSGDEISIEDALVDGTLYDIVLKWRKPEQGFEIVEIR